MHTGEPRRPRPTLARWLALVFLLIANPLPAADSVTISDCTESNLVAAVQAGGLYVYGCAGTVYLTNQIVVSNTVTIRAEAGAVTITSSGTNRLFQVMPGGSLTLQSFTLTGGSAAGASGSAGAEGHSGGHGVDACGGAVWVRTNGAFRGIDLTIVTNAAVGGSGGDGGDGVYADDGPGDGGNGGSARGGAIYNEGVVELTDCALQGNSAVAGVGGGGGDGAVSQDGADAGDGGGAEGGAIFNGPGAELTLANCVLSGNHVTSAAGGTNGLAGTGVFTWPGTIGSTASASGGAIQNAGGAVTLIECLINANAVVAADGVPGVQGATDRESAGGGAGGTATAGAVAVRGGSLRAEFCVFLQNTVEGGIGGDGGLSAALEDGGDGGDGGAGLGGAVAILDSASGWFIGCSFGTNSVQGGLGGFSAAGTGILSQDGRDGKAGAGAGGALWLDTGAIGIERCMLESNVAKGAGGAEGLAGAENRTGATGSSGGAASGAGIENRRGTLAVTNSTFYANSAAGGDGGDGGTGGTSADGGDGGDGGRAAGGALHNESGTTTLIHCTFAANAVEGGGGGAGGEPGGDFADDGGQGAPGARLGSALANTAGALRLRGNLFQAATNTIPNASGTVEDQGYNLSSDSSPTFTATSSEGSLGDLGLLSVTNNGGFTRTLGLTPTSPALSRVPEEAGPPAVDQRGYVRRAPMDVGAYEQDAGQPNPPDLAVAWTLSAIEVSWPADGESYTLQNAGVLPAITWTNLTDTPVLLTNRWVLSIPASSASQGFYRLAR